MNHFPYQLINQHDFDPEKHRLPVALEPISQASTCLVSGKGATPKIMGANGIALQSVLAGEPVTVAAVGAMTPDKEDVIMIWVLNKES